MVSSAAQAKAQALNTKLGGEARIAIDEIDKTHIRRSAQESTRVQCYEKAGTMDSSDA
jgi:hypothetical protein